MVDFEARMHMVSRKDQHSAELETVRTSRSPTTVMTANCEVRKREEATVYVKELDLFVTVMLLEETPAVLSLVNLCEDHGFSYHWTRGQKQHLIQKGKKIQCDIRLYTIRRTCLFTSSSASSTSLTSSSQETVTDTECPAKIENRRARTH